MINETLEFGPSNLVSEQPTEVAAVNPQIDPRNHNNSAQFSNPDPAWMSQEESTGEVVSDAVSRISSISLVTSHLKTNLGDIEQGMITEIFSINDADHNKMLDLDVDADTLQNENSNNKIRSLFRTFAFNWEIMFDGSNCYYGSDSEYVDLNLKRKKLVHEHDLFGKMFICKLNLCKLPWPPPLCYQIHSFQFHLIICQFKIWKPGIHVSNSNLPAPLQHFVELGSRYGCKPYFLRNFAELGYKEPTPIQRQIIPLLLSGLQCFACAPTGSGKTLAFLCPIIMKTKPGSKDGIKAVILCPTRELAAQTTRECKKLTIGRKFHIRCMTKELSRTGDFKNLNCDIIVSTPVRLEYAMRRRKLDLSRVEFLVLDEADKLFELGYIEQIDKITHACSNDSVVRALFSATLPEYVEEFARTKMLDAVRVIVGKKNTAAALIKQKLIYVGSETGKLIALRQSFAESLNPPILIFVQSKERAKQLHKELACEDIKVDLIHADRSQEERENAVDNFRAGKTWVLIATDVIARGMDFKGVNCVINYDFPDSAAAYIHRIGRCGRAGRSGEAITLYTEEDKPFLRNIANVMAESGCEVPAWMLKLPKLRKQKHRPERETISTKAEDVSD